MYHSVRTIRVGWRSLRERHSASPMHEHEKFR
jgi:hypothetical protein